MNRRHRLPQRGKQSFPIRTEANLPVDRLLASYGLNLLPQSPLHSEFLEMIFDQMDLKSSSHAVRDALEPALSSKEKEDLLASLNVDELVQNTLALLEDYGSRTIEKRLRDGLLAVLQNGANDVEKTHYRKRVSRFCELLGVTGAEFSILECIVCYQVSDLFESYCDSYASQDWVALISVAVGLPFLKVRKLIAQDGTLVMKGLVEVGKNSMSTPDSVYHYLTGGTEEFLSRDEFALVEPIGFPLESFPITEKEKGILVDSLRNPSSCHLFFYGRPGTGKTELAKALALESGQQAFLVK